MASTFSAQVSDWVKQTKRRTEGVFKASAQEVFAIAQTPVGKGGNMPIDTGALRASLQVGLNGNIPTETGSEQDIEQAKRGNIVAILAIGQARLGDTINGGWTVNYARAVHDGTRGRPGRLWVDLAAQQWPEIVARISRKAEAKNT